ncbi:MAG: holo-ACP synthase [Zoogloeaceae bacterium]|jgi:holo-[acyl-carrier protein] synthase|nr:holo-ACP synthase [Zoogloeaceae bacterium]
MIYGVGVDIAAVARLETLYTRHGEMGMDRILAAAEQEDFLRLGEERRGRFLARRWAAKEAFGKALGTGLRPPATLTALCVDHDALGKPGFIFSPELQARMEELGLRAHLSISDEARYAIAFVTLEQIVEPGVQSAWRAP